MKKTSFDFKPKIMLNKHSSHLVAQLETNFLQYSERVAVEDGDCKYTYGQLRQYVHALASHITLLQEKKHPIAVLGEPAWSTVVSVLGTIFSGAVYVPIDPCWPSLRIKQILQDAGVRIVIGQLPEKNISDWDIDYFINVQEKQESLKKSGHFKVIPFNFDLKEGLKESFKISQKNPSDLAYIMYTSGSMGHPKAVKVSYESFEHFLHWVEDEFEITSKDRFAFTSSLGFGASLRQIFSPFFSGATLVCFHRTVLKLPSELLKHLHEKQISIFNVPPIVIEQLVNIPFKKYTLNNMRFLFVGGDLFPSQTAKKWFEHFHAKIINLYGSTESIINAASYEVRPPFDQHSLLPIGKPRPGFTFHLQDEKGNSIEQFNQSGLLIIESSFLAKGYHNKEEETKKVFYRKGTSYFYKTGDRAIKLPSGDYLVLGREDRQIQIYGQRIELDEIENTLNQHLEVKRSFVVSFKKDSLNKICAYVQSKTNRHFYF